jgi:cephalosporin hydroxylase
LKAGKKRRGPKASVADRHSPGHERADLDTGGSEVDHKAARQLIDLLDPGSSLSADHGVRSALIEAFLALYQPVAGGDVPSSVSLRQAIIDQFHRLYYYDSDRTWRQTTYRGVPVLKSPLDLWVKQEILSIVRPDLIVETGTGDGGSAYYLADLCDTLDQGRVLSIDIEDNSDWPHHPRVTYLHGSSVDPIVVAKVAAMANEVDNVLVILDSDNSMDHVRQELDVYAPMIGLGSYVIVENTNVHGHPVEAHSPEGPMEAVRGFLTDTDEFEVDLLQEKFLMTFNPSGYLQRVRPASPSASSASSAGSAWSGTGSGTGTRPSMAERHRSSSSGARNEHQGSNRPRFLL